MALTVHIKYDGEIDEIIGRFPCFSPSQNVLSAYKYTVFFANLSRFGRKSSLSEEIF